MKSVCIRRICGPYFPTFGLNMETYSDLCSDVDSDKECGSVLKREIKDIKQTCSGKWGYLGQIDPRTENKKRKNSKNLNFVF